MVVTYKTCGNCNHGSEKHPGGGACQVLRCKCKRLTPKEVRS